MSDRDGSVVVGTAAPTVVTAHSIRLGLPFHGRVLARTRGSDLISCEENVETCENDVQN